MAGAAELASRARSILAIALDQGCVVEAAAGLCRAQPAMAPLWNAGIAAVGAAGDRARWDKALLRWEASGRALETHAIAALTKHGPIPRRVLTCSSSGSVVRVLHRLDAHTDLTVCCAEGRPNLEGRQLATRLASAGLSVELFTDGALGSALDAADVVLVGADAVGSDAWINKAGTRLLAAAALHRGVSVHVLATSDKWVMPSLWPHLSIAESDADEVWPAAPPGVLVRNPCFETIPLELATSVISDAGVLGADLMRDACASLDTPSAQQALRAILQAL